MKEWLEKYRPVRQRTVRSETTKDKAGTFPPAVYAKQKPDAVARVRFRADQDDQSSPAFSEIRSVVADVSLSFVSDTNIPQVTLASAANFNQMEEDESDSEDSDSEKELDSEELIISKPMITRSGRQVKVWTRFDV